MCINLSRLHVCASVSTHGNVIVLLRPQSEKVGSQKYQTTIAGRVDLFVLVQLSEARDFLIFFPPCLLFSWRSRQLIALADRPAVLETHLFQTGCFGSLLECGVMGFFIVVLDIE